MIFLFLGVDIKVVQEMVENHLKTMIIKHFDPKKADSIFTDEGEVYINLSYQIDQCQLFFSCLKIKCITHTCHACISMLLIIPNIPVLHEDFNQDRTTLICY